jgi:hypothetical protein
MDQSDTFRQGESPKTSMDRKKGLLDISPLSIETFDLGKYIKTSTNSEEDKSTIVYQFGEYTVEVKLDPNGKFLYINGDLTPKRKKYCKELFRLDEEFPESPLE